MFRDTLVKSVVGALAFLHVLAAVNGQSPDAATPAAEFTRNVKPFIAKNCLRCHGPKTAKAGYRIDLLRTDFAAPQVAEQWKELVDRINAGEMPPQGQPRPDARDVAAVTRWVNGRLREVEIADLLQRMAEHPCALPAG